MPGLFCKRTLQFTSKCLPTCCSPPGKSSFSLSPFLPLESLLASHISLMREPPSDHHSPNHYPAPLGMNVFPFHCVSATWASIMASQITKVTPCASLFHLHSPIQATQNSQEVGSFPSPPRFTVEETKAQRSKVMGYM